MEKPIRISVITVTLNAINTIARCADSVFAQDYSDIEYIVVDGGSTDGTLEVLEGYGDKIAHLHSGPDQGLYDAMNKGVDFASGDYVYFLNADDRFCNGQVVSAVAEAAMDNVGMDLLYGDVLHERNGELARISHGSVLSRRSVCRYGFPHQALFAKRELFLRNGGFSLKYKIVSDGDWLMRALSDRATSAYVPCDIAVFAAGGLSDATYWRDEKRRVLQAHYSRLELFLWRKLPALLGRR